MKLNETIAFVGMGGIFPEASNLNEFWKIIVHGNDCSSTKRSGEWIIPSSKLINPAKNGEEFVNCLTTYMIDYPIPFLDNLSWDESFIRKLDPLYQIGLSCANQAYKDACLEKNDPARVGVILGSIALPTDSISKIAQGVIEKKYFNQFMKNNFQTRGNENWSDEQIVGWNSQVVGSPAALIKEVFQFGGSAYTLDAACASSLYALQLGIRELSSHRLDAVMIGGLCRPDSMYTQIGFTQLKALSKSGKCSPFDREGDGLLVGEGGGIVVIKRLEDALRDQNTIYGVVRGYGISNDRDGNLLAPAQEGQRRAIDQAYKMANWSMSQVDFIECHATGTPMGDRVEFNSLVDYYRSSSDISDSPISNSKLEQKIALGSIKANLGHLLTGANAASLIKVLLSIKNQTIPPQANFQEANPTLMIDDSPFRILKRSEQWKNRSDGSPRRAAVSGFGFGGINAHLLIEEYRPESAYVNTFNHTSDGESRSNVQSIPDEQRKDLDEEYVIVGLGTYLSNARDISAFSSLGFSTIIDQNLKTEISNRSFQTLDFDFAEFRIPPNELKKMLPQQIAMLLAANQANQDAQNSKGSEEKNQIANSDIKFSVDPAKSGVIISLNLDWNTTNFHLRWYFGEQKLKTSKNNSPQSIAENDIGSLYKIDAPELSADSTLGALASITASRIARHLHWGGASFTITDSHRGGLRALEIALDYLKSGQLDQVLVGGVEFLHDIRQEEIFGANRYPEGACALVIKKKSVAIRDGNKIYAIIKEPKHCSSDLQSYIQSLEAQKQNTSIQRSQNKNRSLEDPLLSFANQIGYYDLVDSSANRYFTQKENSAESKSLSENQIPQSQTSFSGLLFLIKSCLAIRWQRLPADFEKEKQSSYWLIDRETATRKTQLIEVESPSSLRIFELEEVMPILDESGKSTEVIGQEFIPFNEYELFFVAGNSNAELIAHLQKLRKLIQLSDESDLDKSIESRQNRSLSELARTWYQQGYEKRNEKSYTFRIAIVSDKIETLVQQIEEIQKELQERGKNILFSDFRDYGLSLQIDTKSIGKIAFVYPGSGNHYPGMAKSLATRFPSVLRRQESENRFLASQYRPDLFWDAEKIPNHGNARDFIFAQVSFGTLLTDLLRSCGVEPEIVFGNSLGQSASLFGMRIWRDRDEMLQRMHASSLFMSDLAPPYRVAQIFWQNEALSPDVWLAGIVPVSAEEIRQRLKEKAKIYLLIVNSPTECVVGGERSILLDWTKEHKLPFLPLEGVVLSHCEVATPVEAAYRELHTLPVTPLSRVSFYNAITQKPYALTSQNAAETILQANQQMIDFHQLIQTIWKDGARVFVEIGPGSSATRMISQSLQNQAHVAIAMNSSKQDECLVFLRGLAQLYLVGVAIDLDPLYKSPIRFFHKLQNSDASKQNRKISIPVSPLKIIKTQNQLLAESSPPLKLEPNQSAISPVSQSINRSEKSESIPESSSLIDIDANKVQNQKIERSRYSVDALLLDLNAMRVNSQEDDGDSLSKEITESTVFISKSNISPSRNLAMGITRQMSLNVLAQSSFLRITENTQKIFAYFIQKQNSSINNQQLHFDNGFESNNTHTRAEAKYTQSEIIPQSDLLTHQIDNADSGEFNKDLLTNTESEEPVFMTYEDCCEFATGSIGKVLGDRYAEIDQYPTRVRLPEGPLMLVDRVIRVEGIPCSLGSGRVITDHRVHDSRWYLDNKKIPTCIAVEAGQADLFLSGYLGIDLQTKGLAVYRLLDAVVTFHDSLPGPGQTIRYDIFIDHFFKQNDTYLFRFRFDATVNEKPLLTMRSGCAGFFTQEHLRSGKGIVRSKLEAEPAKRQLPSDWIEWVPVSRASYSEKQIDALRFGNYRDAFGEDFANLNLRNPLVLPGKNGGMLKLIDDIEEFDPNGGRYGLGIIRARAAINPNDWYLVCHFVDDQVMPGTLMYECCLHTLRVFLMRLGWIGEQEEICTEPIPGVASRLKCRGQVIESTKVVHYEIEIKELGYRPEPYAIADALMYSDGKPIVEISSMSIRFTGLDKDKLQAIWGTKSTTEKSDFSERRPALYDTAKITSFAVGNPSEAFGEPYRVFDHERVIARLPGPPFQFLDRIVEIHGKPWELQSSAKLIAQYDVPADAWYFTANRQKYMPFSVLLEIALQPCGWLAAYQGSALTSPIDLSFRNLGGTGIMECPLDCNAGSLSIEVCMTKFSNSAGMIIQHFDFHVWNRNGSVYRGNTYFGFFSKMALANQVGLREAKWYTPTQIDTRYEYPGLNELRYPNEFPYPASDYRMIDQIEWFTLSGGPFQQGGVEGSIKVDPSMWFFKAHFYQDPVWPGSLGLESFLQLGHWLIRQKWPELSNNLSVSVPESKIKHSWTYRGQVLPTDDKVRVQVLVREWDLENKSVLFDGFLQVDGRIIYAMNDFSLHLD